MLSDRDEITFGIYTLLICRSKKINKIKSKIFTDEEVSDIQPATLEDKLNDGNVKPLSLIHI